MDQEDIKSQLEDIKKDIEFLMQKRMTQVDYIPGSVKNRTMGEANSFVYSGLSKDRPTKPPTSAMGVAIFYEIDTNKLYVHNGTAWKFVQLA